MSDRLPSQHGAFDRRTLIGAGVVLATGGQGFADDARRGPRFPGDPGHRKLYYGASIETSVLIWERHMHQRLSLHRTFHHRTEIHKLVDAASLDLRYARMPHVSIKTPGQWRSVASGRHDRWIHRLAAGLDGLSAPILLTADHEPETGASRQGTPSEFVAMQDRLIARLGERAPLVTVVPVLSGWTYYGSGPRDPDRWDVPSAVLCGVDVYNPFSIDYPHWVEFGERLDVVKRYVGNRPIVVGEYGCRDDPDHPRRGAQWLERAFAYARDNDIVAMSYFNSGANSPHGTWVLEGRRERSFERILRSSAVARLPRSSAG